MMMAGKCLSNPTTSAANLKTVQLSAETLIVQVQYAASPRWPVGPECYRWRERCFRASEHRKRQMRSLYPQPFVPDFLYGFDALAVR